MQQSLALFYNPYLRLYQSWWSIWFRIWAQPFPSDVLHAHTIDIQRAVPGAFTVGDRAMLTHCVELPDVEAFAELTGDTNPVHLDEDYARESIFKGRIAHGMYTGSFFGTLFGTALPGPGAIYVSQSLTFRAPVKLGDVIRASVELVEMLPKHRARFSCLALVGNQTVLEGEAVLMLPRP
jgi:3-hydroxybutyryl-CoA dehydratase